MVSGWGKSEEREDGEKVKGNVNKSTSTAAPLHTFKQVNSSASNHLVSHEKIFPTPIDVDG